MSNVRFQKMDLAFVDGLSEDSDYLQEVAQNFWLMDDHRWAFYVWEKGRAQNQGPYALVHLDFHYDGVNDFKDTANRERLISVGTDGEIFQMVKNKKHVQCDSFIAPAVIRGLIKEIHFYCKQSEDDTDPGLDSDILEENKCTQSFYTNIKDLMSSVQTEPILFDLCLDLFNKDDDKTYQGTLWPDSEVLAALDACHPLLAKASIVTVSLSFGYSGSEEQTQHLARLAIPRCLSHMNSRK